MPAISPDFLVHSPEDNVAVAVRDLEPGLVGGGVMSGDSTFTVELRAAVPLGHKFALEPIAAGDGVVKYGVQIGVASAPIAAGDHVHVHNLRSVRWQTSIA